MNKNKLVFFFDNKQHSGVSDNLYYELGNQHHLKITANPAVLVERHGGTVPGRQMLSPLHAVGMVKRQQPQSYKS